MDTHAAVQPNENLLLRGWIGRREEPEEQLVLVRRVAADGQEAGIRLAHVEVDIWDSLSIDGEFCGGTLSVYVILPVPPRDSLAWLCGGVLTRGIRRQKLVRLLLAVNQLRVGWERGRLEPLGRMFCMALTSMCNAAASSVGRPREEERRQKA